MISRVAWRSVSLTFTCPKRCTRKHYDGLLNNPEEGKQDFHECRMKIHGLNAEIEKV